MTLSITSRCPVRKRSMPNVSSKASCKCSSSCSEESDRFFRLVEGDTFRAVEVSVCMVHEGMMNAPFSCTIHAIGALYADTKKQSRNLSIRYTGAKTYGL